MTQQDDTNDTNDTSDGRDSNPLRPEWIDATRDLIKPVMARLVELDPSTVGEISKRVNPDSKNYALIAHTKGSISTTLLHRTLEVIGCSWARFGRMMDRSATGAEGAALDDPPPDAMQRIGVPKRFKQLRWEIELDCDDAIKEHYRKHIKDLENRDRQWARMFRDMRELMPETPATEPEEEDEEIPF